MIFPFIARDTREDKNGTELRARPLSSPSFIKNPGFRALALHFCRKQQHTKTTNERTRLTRILRTRTTTTTMTTKNPERTELMHAAGKERSQQNRTTASKTTSNFNMPSWMLGWIRSGFCRICSNDCTLFVFPICFLLLLLLLLSRCCCGTGAGNYLVALY